MHQIAKSDKHELTSVLINLIEESLGLHGIQQLIDELRRRVESTFPNDRSVKSNDR
jgi:hypothetical protein